MEVRYKGIWSLGLPLGPMHASNAAFWALLVISCWPCGTDLLPSSCLVSLCITLVTSIDDLLVNVTLCSLPNLLQLLSSPAAS